MYRRFEALLSCSVNDKHIDWENVLQQTESRIDNAEKLGILAIIKQNEILDEHTYEQIDLALQKRIFEYSEYETPVNECIKAEEDLPANQWERVESKLSVALDALDKADDWQVGLKEEHILTVGRWEKLQQDLFNRIAEHERSRKKRFSWSTWWLFQQFHRFSPGFAALIFVSLIGIITLFGLSRKQDNLPTYVYQAQGSDCDLVGNMLQREYLQSSRGGAIRVVNRHGFTCLQNGAAVKIAEMNDLLAQYQVEMAGDSGSIQDGKATFFVSPRKDKRKFIVKTPDYDISVIGTYFTVIPDLGGKVATQVLKGAVRIQNNLFEDTILTAGQSLVFDKNKNKYVIRDNGPIISKAEIDQMPDLKIINKYHPITLSSNVAYADVSIDGKYKGSTPLRVLLLEGTHNIRITKEDYVDVDTTVTIAKSTDRALYAVLQKPEPVLERIPADVEKAKSGDVDKEKQITSASIEKLLVQDPAIYQSKKAKDLLKQAQAAESESWEKALGLYEDIIALEHAPLLVKETSLFSIGRLKVEHANAKEEAREAFLSYLAFYPDGIFTRESLLRLAELEFEEDQDKAIEYYLKYFEKYPNHYRVSDLQYRVGLIYLQRKEYDEAVYMIKQSLANILHDQPEEKKRRYNSLYKALIEKGDTANAKLVEQY